MYATIAVGGGSEELEGQAGTSACTVRRCARYPPAPRQNESASAAGNSGPRPVFGTRTSKNSSMDHAVGPNTLGRRIAFPPAASPSPRCAFDFILSCFQRGISRNFLAMGTFGLIHIERTVSRPTYLLPRKVLLAS
ncbi:hypothetical protein B0H11DRAFT_1908174 [Mycena galericulata]|nr:hypothetical protein B0H11DRAFT_1908174 [Mycena galericulata]